MSDRRRQPRVRTPDVTARVRPGYRVQVIDLSSGGALLQTRQPFRPGADIEVQLEREQRRVRVAARVLRCSVVAVDPDRGLTYRAALSFAESCELARESGARDVDDVPARGA